LLSDLVITLASGNLFNADVEALVNAVNCVGVMGKGLALQFKERFPANFKAYAKACKAGEVRTGAMFVFATGLLQNPRFLVNFPTKQHWRDSSRIEDIEAGLQSLVVEVRDRRIRSIAVPALGCGLGGLEWREVRPRIDAACSGRSESDPPAALKLTHPTAPRPGPEGVSGRSSEDAADGSGSRDQAQGQG
jgi:O-acetyl-ADP-ribose deacetylase (regulator of RNase III)